MNLEGYFRGGEPDGERKGSEQEKSFLIQRFGDLLVDCVNEWRHLANMINKHKYTSSHEDANRLANAVKVIKDNNKIDKNNVDTADLKRRIANLELALKNMGRHINTYYSEEL